MMPSQFHNRRPVADQPSLNPAYSHSRTRTTSSNTFPNQYQYQQQPPPPQQQQPYNQQYPQMHMHLHQPPANHQRRSPSVNTFSTISSGGMAPPAAYKTSPTTDIRRSTSSRSGGDGGGAPGSPQPSGYVALLRKQKATVWCDRAQYEDPRLLAQQRAAKRRAHLEVVGSNSGLGLGSGSGRTSTGLSSAGGKVAAKIRHHGKPAVIGYSPDSNFIGVGGVPVRLSATEVEGEDSDEDDTIQRFNHRRTGSSSRSSTASGKRGLGYRSSGGVAQSNSLSGGRRWSPNDTPERSGSLVEEHEDQTNYAADDAASGTARSFGSGSSAERLDNVPDLSGQAARLAANSLMHATLTREKSVKNPEDLRRRGSVDERTVSLNTTGRLFIANPD